MGQGYKGHCLLGGQFRPPEPHRECEFARRRNAAGADADGKRMSPRTPVGSRSDGADRPENHPPAPGSSIRSSPLHSSVQRRQKLPPAVGRSGLVGWIDARSPLKKFPPGLLAVPSMQRQRQARKPDIGLTSCSGQDRRGVAAPSHLSGAVGDGPPSRSEARTPAPAASTAQLGGLRPCAPAPCNSWGTQRKEGDSYEYVRVSIR